MNLILLIEMLEFFIGLFVGGCVGFLAAAFVGGAAVASAMN